jgi:hypothetical protein
LLRPGPFCFRIRSGIMRTDSAVEGQKIHRS